MANRERPSGRGRPRCPRRSSRTAAIVLGLAATAGCGAAEPEFDPPPADVSLFEVADAATRGDDPIRVPLDSIVRPPGHEKGFALYVVDPPRNGSDLPRVRRRVVSLGWTSRDHVTVVEGLTGGERVVVRGATRIRDGQRVRPSR